MLHQGEEIFRWIMLNEQLQRTDPQRTVVPDDGRGHDVPAESFTDQIGSNLPSIQTRVKVPQRALALLRFIHRTVQDIAMRDLNQKRRITAVEDPPYHTDVTMTKHVFNRRLLLAVH